MKRRLKLGVIFMLVFGLIGYLAGVLVTYFTGDHVESNEALTNSLAFILLEVGAFIGLGIGLFTTKKWPDIDA